VASNVEDESLRSFELKAASRECPSCTEMDSTYGRVLQVGVRSSEIALCALSTLDEYDRDSAAVKQGFLRLKTLAKQRLDFGDFERAEKFFLWAIRIAGAEKFLSQATDEIAKQEGEFSFGMLAMQFSDRSEALYQRDMWIQAESSAKTALAVDPKVPHGVERLARVQELLKQLRDKGRSRGTWKWQNPMDSAALQSHFSL